MSYNINSENDGCYENTLCLINKFDIRDEKILAKIESEITLGKMSYLDKFPIAGKFDFEHYKAIHRFLFEDIYEWAGCIRTINFSKKGTNFADKNDIESLSAACFDRLSSMNFFIGLPFNEYISNIVDFYCTTNMIHPFREGNGRTQRAFLSQLIRHAGYSIDFSDVDADELMIATIQSANGVTDNLFRIFSQIIKK